MRFAGLLSLLLFISSCSTINHSKNRFIQVEDDPFKPSIIYNGISKTQSNEMWFQNKIVYSNFIKSFKDRESGDYSHELRVTVTYYGNWHNFERTAYKGGTDAEFVFINDVVESCDGNTCKLTERFAIPLNESFLKNNLDGFSLKAFAQSGQEIILDVTNLQINGQLSYLGLK